MKQDQQKPQRPGEYWSEAIDEATEHFKSWVERGDKVVDRYRDERASASKKERRYNILWANTEVLKPALYGRKAVPEVSRRHKDRDPISRTASMILERCLEYEVEKYPDYDQAMSSVVEDRLLPGRGTTWVRFEPSEVQVTEDEDGKTYSGNHEQAVCDYVYWKDFLHTPARTWAEVWWVARKVYMTREEGIKRFGEVFKHVPLVGNDEAKPHAEAAENKKAAVWEIWDKSDKTVYWKGQGYPRILDHKPDPLQLEEFFPCPRPLFATTTTGSLIPVPDYVQYQDQAEELDKLTQRINKLTAALKVNGVYNAEFKEIRRILNEGVDNTMIPVDSWAMFAEKGGIKGAMEFVPIDQVFQVLNGLYESREAVKVDIYEIIGISDIIRGSSDPNETLGAQQLKANYGSLRLRDNQGEVAIYATDLLRKKAQIICQFFSDKTIIEMSGIMNTPDARNAPQALQLLRSDVRNFRIEVQADSLAQLDENKEKQDRVEFLSAVGGYLEKALPIIQSSPAAGPLLGEMLLFGVRGFKAGRSMESLFEQAIEQMSQSNQLPENIRQQIEAKEQQIAEQGQQVQQAGQQLAQEREAFQKFAQKVQQDATNNKVESIRIDAEKKVMGLDKQYKDNILAFKEKDIQKTGKMVNDKIGQASKELQRNNQEAQRSVQERNKADADSKASNDGVKNAIESLIQSINQPREYEAVYENGKLVGARVS